MRLRRGLALIVWLQGSLFLGLALGAIFKRWPPGVTSAAGLLLLVAGCVFVELARAMAA